jgi:hypothetical protein
MFHLLLNVGASLISTFTATMSHASFATIKAEETTFYSKFTITADFKSMWNPQKKIGCLYLLASAEGWDPGSCLYPLSRIC